MKHKLIRTNGGKTIHRAGCMRLAHAKHSRPWDWADNLDGELIAAIAGNFGYALCKSCDPLKETP